ncbi:MAG: electron transport complex subunit RsxA [Proteobacteria bacterium]|nr:MAG: electron transport complex subunit RsxA [Pseudomonadota bacterium]
MSELLIVLLSAVLLGYFGLTRLPALRPFVGLSDPFEAAGALGVVTFATLVISAPLIYAWDVLVLAGMELEHLRTLTLMMIILVVVQGTALALERVGRWLPERPGFVVLLGTNSLLLGVALLSGIRRQDFVDAMLFAAAAGAAFAVLLLAFTALYERLRHAAVPAAFREAPLALVTAGIMALAFMGFAGLVRD